MPANWKSAALVPEKTELTKVMFAVPLFFRVANCAPVGVPIVELPKFMLGGVNPIMDVVPVPLRGTVCGEPEALSVTVSVPVNGPALNGAKVTTIVQERLAPRLAGQLFVWLKFPVMPILEIVREEVPTFVTTSFWEGLAVFTFWLPKERLAALKEMTGLPLPTNS